MLMGLLGQLFDPLMKRFAYAAAIGSQNSEMIRKNYWMIKKQQITRVNVAE